MKVQIRQENELTSGSTQESEWRKFRFVFFLFFLLFLDILIVTAKITLRIRYDGRKGCCFVPFIHLLIHSLPHQIHLIEKAC